MKNRFRVSSAWMRKVGKGRAGVQRLFFHHLCFYVRQVYRVAAEHGLRLYNLGVSEVLEGIEGREQGVNWPPVCVLQEFGTLFVARRLRLRPPFPGIFTMNKLG